jgi:hypothetical protein
MEQKEKEIVAEFRRQLCHLYGYDENLKFVGTARSDTRATESRAFLEPRDFLNFAVEDSSELEKERNRINCLSNCKRAIDSQVDRLIHSLGLLPLANKERWSIPKKLDFISGSGVVAPRILRNVNQLRNRLEHEFAAPSQLQVEDALDVATLFISYAELVRIPSLRWTLSNKMTVRYDYDEMSFDFFEKEPSDSEQGERAPLFSLAHGDQEFLDLYDFLVRLLPLMERKWRLGEDIKPGARLIRVL